MARARSLEHGTVEGDRRGAATAAPRSNPLKLVEAAVAGDDLQSVARAAALALSCTVAIALPAFGLSAQWPATSSQPETIAAVQHYAAALVADRREPVPPELSDVVPVRLGHDVVGVVAALAKSAEGLDANPWLEATAAAAAVAALMRDSTGSDVQGARRGFLQMLELHSTTNPEALLTHARRLGYDFSQGAVAVSAELPEHHRFNLDSVSPEALVADVGAGRLLGLVPLSRDGSSRALDVELDQFERAELRHVASTPRRSITELQHALQEAAVLLELLVDPDAGFKVHEETYRLLVSVLIHNPDELAQLQTSTIAELDRYDASHDTELVTTLDTFLRHHGSTTDTAEAMQLHRHTVGYRLARVQEVSGLSPYESEGRERLSLGLKANRIMLAENRRAGRARPA